MKFEEETVLKIIALTIGTTDTKGNTPNHKLDYLLKKLYGLDGLSLDFQNTLIFNRLVEVKNNFKK